MSPLGSSAGYKVQGVGKGRGVKTPAFSYSPVAYPDLGKMPDSPALPGHSFFFVTPSGDESAFEVATGDLLDMSTWFVAVYATSEKGQRHMHYLISMPSENKTWLSRHPTIFRSGRHIPCVKYTSLSGSCSMSFSEITNLGGLKKYLEGPRNRSKFVVLSPRAVWQPNPAIRQEEQQGTDFETPRDCDNLSFTRTCPPVHAQVSACPPATPINTSISAIQKGRQSVTAIDRTIRCHFDSS